MQSSLVLSFICLSLAVTLCAARHSPRPRPTITPTDVPCTPRRSETCGEYTLVGETSTPLTDVDGPNVCEIARDYTVLTYSYVETEYCFGMRCRTFCARTNNCTGPIKNFTQTHPACCDGFAVDLNNDNNQKGHRHSISHRRRHDITRQGCPIMLSESVAECLLDLDLESFTTELDADASDILSELDNSDNDGDRFTIFAINSTEVDASVDTLGHVVNGTVSKKFFLYGGVLPSLREDVFLHVVKGVQTKNFYVNGVKIEELNACQARNGVVHVVDSPIPQSTMTIAQTLRADPRFSLFAQLLDAANATMLLDMADGKSKTVLAPTDEAFDELPDNAAECLLRPENSRYLSKILSIHFSTQAEFSATLSQRSRLYTSNPRYYLSVRTDDQGNILISNDRIPLEEADIAASNGVIHAIPEVIVPPKVDFDKICEEEGGSGDSM